MVSCWLFFFYFFLFIIIFVYFILFFQLKPVTDIVFPFDEAIAAYQHMENGSHTGKTIISMQ